MGLAGRRYAPISTVSVGNIGSCEVKFVASYHKVGPGEADLAHLKICWRKISRFGVRNRRRCCTTIADRCCRGPLGEPGLLITSIAHRRKWPRAKCNARTIMKAGLSKRLWRYRYALLGAMAIAGCGVSAYFLFSNRKSRSAVRYCVQPISCLTN